MFLLFNSTRRPLQYGWMCGLRVDSSGGGRGERVPNPPSPPSCGGHNGFAAQHASLSEATRHCEGEEEAVEGDLSGILIEGEGGRGVRVKRDDEGVEW